MQQVDLLNTRKVLRLSQQICVHVKILSRITIILNGLLALVLLQSAAKLKVLLSDMSEDSCPFLRGITTALPSTVVQFDAAVKTLVDFKVILVAKCFATLVDVACECDRVWMGYHLVISDLAPHRGNLAKLTAIGATRELT